MDKNKKIPKIYNNDILKDQLKIDKKSHIKVKHINHKINQEINSKINNKIPLIL